MHRPLLTAILSCLPLCLLAGGSAVQPLSADPVKQTPSNVFSLERAEAYLDKAADDWLTQHQCASCHSVFPYALVTANTPRSSGQSGRDKTEAWIAKQVADGDASKPFYTFKQEASLDTEVIWNSLILATRDAGSIDKKLQSDTQATLDRMWKRQGSNGAWQWLTFASFIPWETETETYAGVALAVAATGTAPQPYSQSPLAVKGLGLARNYFHTTAAPNLHHQMLLLWAASKTPDFLTPTEQTAIRDAVFARQQSDGGWSLPSLYDVVSTQHPDISDGYGTGYTLFILRHAGVPTNDRHIQKAIQWLQGHQSGDGSWEAPSLRGSGKSILLSHMGTAFAVMGLKKCLTANSLETKKNGFNSDIKSTR